LLLVCGGALLLMLRGTLLLVHRSALLFVFYRALLVVVLRADTLMTHRALLHIYSIAHFFHLRLAALILHSAALLLVLGTALVFVGRLCFVLGMTLPMRLLGHIPSVHGEGQQNSGQASKQVVGTKVHLLRLIEQK